MIDMSSIEPFNQSIDCSLAAVGNLTSALVGQDIKQHHAHLRALSLAAHPQDHGRVKGEVLDCRPEA